MTSQHSVGSTFRRRRLGLFVLGVALAAGWLPAGAQTTTADARRTGRLPDVLVVGGDRDNPPYEFLDHGVPSGYNVDLIKAVGEAMNLPVEVRLGAWEDVRFQLENGKIDALAGMYYSDLRSRSLDFSVPHTLVTPSLFVRDGSPIQRFEDARGREILVQQSDIVHDLLREQRFSAHLIPRTDPSEVVQALAAGEHDCALVPSELQGYYFIERYKLKNLHPVHADLPALQYCFAVRKGNPQLVATLDEGLNILKKNGRYRQIYEKWFGVYEARQFGWSRVSLIGAATSLVLLLTAAGWVWSLRTQVRRRTEALEQSERKLRAVFDQTYQMIGVVTLDGRLVEANRTALEFGGTNKRDVLGVPLWQTPWWNHSPEAQQRLRAAIAEAANGRTIRTETTHLAVDGRLRHIDFTLKPERDHSGRIIYLIAEGHDITDREEARLALVDNEEKYRSVVESVNELIATVDERGEVVFVNGPGARLLGGRPEDFTGRSLRELFDEAFVERLLVTVRTVNRTATPAVVEDSAVVRGSRRQFRLTVSPTKVSDARFVHIVAFDLTERASAEETRKRLEEQLRQAQKMEAIGRIAGGVAHDFNNLLSPILGYSDLLLQDLPPGSDAATEVAAIREAAQRAAGIARQLLAFSSKQVLDMQVVNLADEVASFAKMLRRLIGEDIELVTRAETGCGCIRADVSQIHQVIMNLAVNARDAMPNGGRLVVETANATVGADLVQRHAEARPGDYVVLVVSDNGEGMDAETMAHAFEPFFTTKSPGKGTGLGLATVYGVAKQHGAFIDLESRIGQGSTFRVFFPRIADAAEAQPGRAAPAGAGASGQTILVAEDDELVCDLVRRVLTQAGYQVLCAKDGDEALRLAREHQGRIALLLTDVVMPKVSGKVLYQQVKELSPQLKVVFMSGYSSEKSLVDPGTPFLAKPFTVQDLIVMATEATGGAESSG